MGQNTRAAARELTSASRYQKNARKRACWLMLILCVILTIVLLAVIAPLLVLSLILGTKLELFCNSGLGGRLEVNYIFIWLLGDIIASNPSFSS